MRLVVIPLLIVVMVTNTARAEESPQLAPCLPSQSATAVQVPDTGNSGRLSRSVATPTPAPAQPSMNPLPPCAATVRPQVRIYRRPRPSPKAEGIMKAFMVVMVVAALFHGE